MRDPALREECAALCRALARFPTLTALRASPDWPALESRLGRVLGTIRRYQPDVQPAAAKHPDRVLALHWNIEHGNWYEQVERALLSHPLLAGTDLLMFNEIDLGTARAGNRDVTGDLAKALGFYGVWAPLFLETTLGRDDDVRMATGRENEESLFGLAILSRWPIGQVRLVELPSPDRLQFDVERMYGRHIALLAEIRRPGAGGPFLAVSAHLEVHRTRAERATQVAALVQALRDEGRPIILAGDFNSHTFDRGRWWDPLMGGLVLLLWPTSRLSKRLHYPDSGATRETLFDQLRDADFEWNRFNDRRPTLQLRLNRLDEARGVLDLAGRLFGRLFAWVERRGSLRLDWFAGRGWRHGHGATIAGLDGPGKASDHAPIVAEFR
jgi:endonuclease/exonuclease/phosphatase family metal-dependent hydrolase